MNLRKIIKSLKAKSNKNFIPKPIQARIMKRARKADELFILYNMIAGKYLDRSTLNTNNEIKCYKKYHNLSISERKARYDKLLKEYHSRY